MKATPFRCMPASYGPRLFLVVSLFWAQTGSAALSSDEPEATSLLGKPLYRSALQGDIEKLRSNLAKAQADYEKNPNDADAIIWLGRRTAYLWRYSDAIAIYNEGVKKHPNNAKLYRHRGHRYISLREFDKAIADLEKAAELTANIPDEIEPDGAPNKYNIPRSTLKSNIWYHLGLVYYLKGNFSKAADAYAKCLKYSKNDDMLCATSDWLYMTYLRLGNKKAADKVLDPIHEEMEILENTSYHNRLLMYKGVKSPDDLLNLQDPDQLTIATQGYGVGNWYLYIGETEKAREVFEQVVAGNYWPAFGHIAAEAELVRFKEALAGPKLQPTVYLVRHAEKLDGWPEGGSIGQYWPLSSQGVARAQLLTEFFKDIPLSAIYSSSTTRTLHTAFPVSQAKDLPITIVRACMDTSAINEFYESLNDQFDSNDAVLVVTHSNLVAYFLIKAGLPMTCQETMGFTHPANTSWILIKGYDNIWKIAKHPDESKECRGFGVSKY